MMIRNWLGGTATVLAATLLLAGCGSGAAPPHAAPAAAGGGFSADAGPGVFPRTVTHDQGQTVIPARPQRVVVLDTGELDSVLSLGVTPAGVTRPDGQPQPYLADRVVGVPQVGETHDLDLEAIARLQPDLILGSSVRAEKFYPQLSAIAPTVFAATAGVVWKDNFRLAGLALGAEQKVDQVMGDYRRRTDALATRAGAEPPKVSLVRFTPQEIRLYGRKSFAGTVLADAGLRRPPIQDVDEFRVNISREEIGKAAGDVVLYTSFGLPEATSESAVVGSPSWTVIPAVAEGRAKRVSDDVWYLGLGPLGAGRVLDDLERLGLTG